MNNKEKPYVYFVQCNNSVKIGVSWTPDIRMEDMQTSNPYELKLIGVIKNGGYEKEKEIHEQFIKNRIRNEWFKLDDDLISFIKKNVSKWKPRIYEINYK